MSSSDYDIRRLTVADIPAFIDLRGRMFTEVGFKDLDDLNDVSADYFTHAVPSEEFIGYVAISETDAVVGSAGMSLYTMPPKPIQADGRFGYVSSMYVLSEHRRNGLARRMMRALIEYADEIDLVWITLHASKMGQPIYESIGFKVWKEMGLHVPTAMRQIGEDASGK
jgi:ribosomal protein S18 acetylase RimI-like enzyme